MHYYEILVLHLLSSICIFCAASVPTYEETDSTTIKYHGSRSYHWKKYNM